jgi:lipid-binding SYLF domain-containing protein
MKINILKFGRQSRILCLIAGITLLLSIGFLDSALAAGEEKKEEKKVDTKKIDTEADAALKRLHGLEGGKEFAEKAEGLLIMPNVGKGDLIIGIEHGKGALRIGGKTVDYYSMSSGSVGLQIGGEAKDIIIAFLTTEALEQFHASDRWEAGVDGNIAVIAAGDGGTASNFTTDEPITAIVFDVKGLFFDVSLKGGKFSKLDK